MENKEMNRPKKMIINGIVYRAIIYCGQKIMSSNVPPFYYTKLTAKQYDRIGKWFIQMAKWKERFEDEE